MPKKSFATKKPRDLFRILHTADWHLGKMLNDQSRDEEHALFLDWLLDIVKTERIDAIIVAGDVFDTANPPQSALARYYDFVSTLFRQSACAFVVIGGNHDSAAQLEAPKQALRALNTHVAGFLAEDPANRVLCLPEGAEPRVAIALLPFLRDRDLRVGKAGEGADEIREQLVEGIRARYAETAEATADLTCPVIGTGHLTVVGAARSESERDIHIGGLGAVTPESFPESFCYIALGHLHRPQAPDGDERIHYAGSPIPLSFSESDDVKEVRILDVSEEKVSQRGLEIPVWRRLAQIRTTTATLEDDLAAFEPKSGELPTWVEVLVEGAGLEDDLAARVRELTEDRDFEALKVVRGRPVAVAAMGVGDATDDEAFETLLDNPEKVFEHLLERYEELTESEIEPLKTTFTKLVELHQERLAEEVA